jgi:TRAP-type C4-dicarboxylate transport system permease small subunit
MDNFRDVLAPYVEPTAPLWERILLHMAVCAVCGVLVWLSWST